MLLVANTCLSSLIFECILFAMTIFSLNNDRQEILFQDNLCITRSYISYSFSAMCLLVIFNSSIT